MIPTNAQPLRLNESINGQITDVPQGYDHDDFKLTLAAGVYTIELSLGAPGQLTASYLSVENQIAGVKTEYLSMKENKTTFSFVAPVAGEYYLSVGGDEYNANSRIGTYGLRVVEAYDDYGFVPGHMGTLAPGATVQAELEAWLPDDIDGFAIDLQGGVNYEMRLGQAPVPAHAYYSPHGILTLLDGAGNLMAAKTGRVFDHEDLTLAFTPTVAGKYYVHVANDGGGNYSGFYTLTAAVATGDEAGDTIATARTISGDGAFRGKLDIPSDIDVFHIPVQSGTSYAIGVQAAGSGKVSLNTLQGSAKWTEQTVAGQNLSIFTVTESGDLNFRIDGWALTGSTPYVLTAEKLPSDDLVNLRESATEKLNVGSIFHGNIDYAGDSDWIKVFLQAGTIYTVEAWGETTGGKALPMSNVNAAQLYNPDGVSVALINNFQYSSSHSYTAPVSGDYYISVKGVETGHYALQVRNLANDHTAPALQSFNVSKVAAGVLPSTDLKLSFDEYVNAKDNLVLKDQFGTVVQRWYDWTVGYDDRNVTLKIQDMLALGREYTLELGAGSVSDMAGNGIAATALRFTTVPGATAGSAGNDYLAGTGWGDQLDGKGGIDTAVYASYRNSYIVKQDQDGYSIGYPGSLKNDHLANIERLLFKDAALALDIDGAAGQGYRLYRAAFDRTPDKAGVGYWITQLDNGAALRDVAASFIASAEFQTRYGTNLDNTAFTLNLYQNVLHRTPDQPGVDYWVGVLNGGTQRADVLTSFSESPENKVAVAAIIGNGFEYTPYG